MALTSNITFPGKYAFDYFSAALFDNSILNRFEIYEGNQNTIIIPRVSLIGHTQPGACAPSDNGDITLDPVNLNVCKFNIWDRICRSEVEPTFLSINLPAGANNDALPTDFSKYIMSELISTIGNNMQNFLWNGVAGGTQSASYLNQCDGLIEQAKDDVSVIDITATASAITPANVEGEIARVFLAVPANVKSSGLPYTIFVSQQIADAYAVAQGNLAYSLDSTTKKEMRYAGVELVVAPFVPAKFMYATPNKNIAIGADLKSDMTSISIIDEMNTTGKPSMIVSANWKFGMVHKLGSEVVMYL